MRHVVVVDPGDRRADLHAEALRNEGELIDVHLDVGGLCRGDAKRGRRREDGGGEYDYHPAVVCDPRHDRGGPLQRCSG